MWKTKSERIVRKSGNNMEEWSVAAKDKTCMDYQKQVTRKLNEDYAEIKRKCMWTKYKKWTEDQKRIAKVQKHSQII